RRRRVVAGHRGGHGAGRKAGGLFIKPPVLAHPRIEDHGGARHRGRALASVLAARPFAGVGRPVDLLPRVQPEVGHLVVDLRHVAHPEAGLLGAQRPVVRAAGAHPAAAQAQGRHGRGVAEGRPRAAVPLRVVVLRR
ncbi:unnamed protein product, partial [Heterosigma akashiwo]